MLGVNLRGSINVLRAAWPHLERSPAGRVVNTSSPTVVGLPGALTYATAKAAILGLTKNLVLATEGTPIKVNAIWPFGSSRMSSTDFAAMFEATYGLESGHFNRTLTAEAVANGVLCCATSRFPPNGEIFAVGGGRMARVFIAACARGLVRYARGLHRAVDRGVRTRRVHDPRACAGRGGGEHLRRTRRLAACSTMTAVAGSGSGDPEPATSAQAMP